jgi:formylglycine-generating enzyme required for sulfatase activity
MWCAAVLGLVLATALLLPAAPASAPDKPAPLDCTGKDGASAADVRKAQEARANHLGRKVEETVEVADGVKMTFVLVPPGKFLMGLSRQEEDFITKVFGDGQEARSEHDSMRHEVTLTAPFDLAKTEVTQAQYRALGLGNPSRVKGDTLPVETVSWNEARDWAALLTKRRADNHRYRLPTQAEWEFACRGGRPTSQLFGVGDGRSLSSREANFDGNYPWGDAGKGPYREGTCGVAKFSANVLGLCDMHGNVWEWCQDYYEYFSSDPVTDPAGATNPFGLNEDFFHVYRGGSWRGSAWSCRAAHRRYDFSSTRESDRGFRLARSLPSSGK